MQTFEWKQIKKREANDFLPKKSRSCLVNSVNLCEAFKQENSSVKVNYSINNQVMLVMRESKKLDASEIG